MQRVRGSWWTARLAALLGIAAGGALLLGTGGGASAQVPPAPSNVGTRVPLPYNGANAAEVNPSFVGPLQLLRSGQMDLSDPNAPTITIPLYRGQMRDGRAVWYILTDTN
ncbi:MAG: hypothetical protein M3442_20545, partial [Chloroflexota bacterium]|nr:hypothetical protein [Chloroflexota bacterium]